ncbi:hypothetical protein OAU50_05300 [Planctomycetota bacterium]|nr:hypothetical protein [Planctomycetota bacterium]
MKRILMMLVLGGLLAVGANAQDAGDGMGDGEMPSTEKPAETKPEAPTDEKKTDAKGDKKAAKKAEKKADKERRKGAQAGKNYRELGSIIRELDTDKDRKISKEELGDDETFATLDKDEDGFLTAQEMLADVEAVKAAMVRKADALAREEFTILDRDDSEKLSEAELGTEFAALMEGDTDDDKELDFEEFIAARKKAREAKREEAMKKARDPANMMKAIDKDADGKISKDEAKRNLKKNFDRIDANSDGFIDADELKKVLDSMGSRRNGQRGQGKKRDGDQPGDKNKPETGPAPQSKKTKPTPKPAPKDDPNSAQEDEF